jgi:DNA-binding transcriptional ArsR family regulator
MHYLIAHPPSAVSDVSRDLRIPLSVASESLRLLNSRGLLRATRSGRWVVYSTGADPTIEHAPIILRALRGTLRPHQKSVNQAFSALTGFTHPRRIAVFKALADGPSHLAELRSKTGISTPALQRHLGKLRRRGYVQRHRGLYSRRCPQRPLLKALMELAARA